VFPKNLEKYKETATIVLNSSFLENEGRCEEAYLKKIFKSQLLLPLYIVTYIEDPTLERRQNGHQRVAT